MKFALLENAVDFVSVGIEVYFSAPETVSVASPPPSSAYFQPIGIRVERELNPIYRTESRRLKHSLINVFAGILLLMKERLRRIQPRLVYSNIDREPKPDSSTINFDETLARTKSWGKLEIKFSRYERLLRRAQRERNRLEHNEFEAHKRTLESLIPKLVEFAYLFAAKELEYDIRSALGFEVQVKLDELKSVAAHVAECEEAERRAIIQRYTSLAVEELEELANVEDYHPKYNPEPIELSECPECDQETFRLVVEDNVGVCTDPDCHYVDFLGACVRCGAPTTGFQCEYCEGYMAHQMDRD